MLKCLSKKKRLEVSWIRMCCFVFIFIRFYAYFDFFFWIRMWKALSTRALGWVMEVPENS